MHSMRLFDHLHCSKLGLFRPMLMVWIDDHYSYSNKECYLPVLDITFVFIRSRSQGFPQRLCVCVLLMMRTVMITYMKKATIASIFGIEAATATKLFP